MLDLPIEEQSDAAVAATLRQAGGSQVTEALLHEPNLPERVFRICRKAGTGISRTADLSTPLAWLMVFMLSVQIWERLGEGSAIAATAYPLP